MLNPFGGPNLKCTTKLSDDGCGTHFHRIKVDANMYTGNFSGIFPIFPFGINLWYIYLDSLDFYGINVGSYTIV